MMPRPLKRSGDGVRVSAPGAAGHALLFRDHIILKKDMKARSAPLLPQCCCCCCGGCMHAPVLAPRPEVAISAHFQILIAFAARGRLRQTPRRGVCCLVLTLHTLIPALSQDFPSTALTFEAWISSSDFCHSGARGAQRPPGRAGLQKGARRGLTVARRARQGGLSQGVSPRASALAKAGHKASRASQQMGWPLPAEHQLRGRDAEPRAGLGDRDRHGSAAAGLSRAPCMARCSGAWWCMPAASKPLGANRVGICDLACSGSVLRAEADWRGLRWRHSDKQQRGELWGRECGARHCSFGGGVVLVAGALTH
jgi:hypothetical protein